MSEPTQLPRTFIFFGDDGLRAGWSIALFSSPFLLITGLLLLMEHYLGLGTTRSQVSLTPSAAIFGEAIQFILLAAAAFGMSFIEHRPFARYGLPPTRLLPDLTAGLAWGAVMLSVLIAALYLTHAIAFDGFALHGTATIAYAAEWAIAFLCVGLLEEFLFRGYLQFTLARGISGIVRALSLDNPDSHFIGFWVAAFLLSGCIFAYTHTANDGETLTGILAVACAGGVFAFSLWRTGSLWWGIGFHAAWDWAQSYLYGTPDSGNTVQGHLLATHPIGARLLSGGSDGPEGSILVIPTLLLAAVVIHVTLPRRTPKSLVPSPQSLDPAVQRTAPHPRSTA